MPLMPLGKSTMDPSRSALLCDSHYIDYFQRLPRTNTLRDHARKKPWHRGIPPPISRKALRYNESASHRMPRNEVWRARNSVAQKIGKPGETVARLSPFFRRFLSLSL